MPKGNSTICLTPVGRIVSGHPIKRRPKLDDNNRPVLTAEGKQVMVIYYALAIPKADFVAHVWPKMAAEIAPVYPNIPPNMSLKYKDGDGIDSKGKKYSDREGWGGCFVLQMSHEFDNAIPVVRLVNGAYMQVAENEIKTGDYARVEIGMVCEPRTNATHTPSIYLNSNLVEWLGVGREIHTAGAVDAMASLGGQVVALPPGAQPIGAAPVLPAGGPVPSINAPLPLSAPAVVQPVAMPAVMPVAAPAAMPTASPGNVAMPLQPAHDFVAAAPVIQPAPVIAPVAAAPTVINGVAVAGYDAATGKPWGMVNGVATFLQ